MIADAVVLVGIWYVERRMKAETAKIQEVEAEHVEQEHEMEKAAKNATAVRQRTRNRQQNKKHNTKLNMNNGHVQTHFNIQQPSKRN